MTDVEIRLATEDDAEGYLATTIALFAEDAGSRDVLRDADWPKVHGREAVAADLVHPDRVVLVAVAEGEVVAHLLGRFHTPTEMMPAASATLLSLYTRPEWRSRAVGARLVERFTDWARERGAARMQVTAYSANEGAVRFYERQGFAAFELTLAAAL